MFNKYSGTDEADDLAPGSLFNGFVVERVLGKGGFGTTYLLSKREENDLFVLKSINVDRLSDKGDIENFYNEASKMLQIPAHPNIVRVINAWVDPQTHTPYLATEYVPQGDLWTYAKQHGRFSNFECWWVLLNLAEGMRFIFENVNLLHRDLKPQNLLLDENGIIKITDFGLAKATPISSRALNRIASGDKSTAVGTAFFMSPEQIRGERHIDEQRSDIWSIGISLYWLATGKLPFQGAKIKQEIVSLNPPRPSTINSEIDEHLEEIIWQCMQKDPIQRFESFRELEWVAIQNARRIPNFIEKISTSTRFISPQAIENYLTPYFSRDSTPDSTDDLVPDESDWLSYVQRLYQIISINNLPLAQDMVASSIVRGAPAFQATAARVLIMGGLRVATSAS